MTDAQPTPTDPRSTAHIRLPGVAVGFFIISPILLLLGYMIFMGTSSRDFFNGAPAQAALGAVIFLTGLGALLVAFALEGARSVAQQHLDALAEIEQARGYNG